MLADRLIDGDQFRAQFLEAMVLIDLGLRFAPCRGRRKRFGNGSTVHSPCQADLRIMSRIVGFSAVTGWLSATARDGTDRTRTQIAESGELAEDFGTLGF